MQQSTWQWGIALATLVFPAAMPAYAQDNLRTSGGETGFGVEDIIVTAQRREQRISDVPISISALSAAELNDIAAKNGGSLQGLIPALTINATASYGGSPVSIRGTSGLDGAEDPVAVYVDDVYTSSGQFSVTALSDVASLEVLRGPQGTLQGRNATAGAILIRTADPEFDFGGYVRGSLENPMAWRLEGAVTGPLTDKLAIRLSADRVDERGWAKNLFNGHHLGGTKMYNLRGILLWKPVDDFRARLSVNYQNRRTTQPTARWGHTNIHPAPGPATPVGTETPQIPLTPAQEAFLLDGKFVDLNIDPWNKLTSPSVVLNMQYDFGPATLISVTGWSNYTNDGVNDSDGLAMTDRQGRNTGHYTGSSFSQELRLQSNGSRTLDWIIGYYYARYVTNMDFDIYNLTLSQPFNQVSNFRSHQTNPNWAVFADATLHLADTLSVIGGVRHTRDTKNFDNIYTSTAHDSGTTLFQLPFEAPKRSWSDTSFRAKLVWQPNTDTLAYLSYSKGFKAGGYNGFGVGPQPGYDPEVMKSWEAGVKASLFERRLFITAAAYDNRYDNLQVTSGVPTGGVIITNAASAKIRGFEIEAEARPLPEWSISGNIAYIDGKFSNFKFAPDLLGILRDVSGNRLTNAPEWQYFVQTQYQANLGADWTARAAINWRWRGEVFFTPADQNLRHLRGRPDGELGARLSFEYQPRQLTVSLYGSNLTDRRVVANEALTFSYIEAFFNRPRTLGMQVEKRF